MLVRGKHYRTVWMNRTSVFMIDQNALPFSFKIKEYKTYKDTALAIKNMTVRGAPAIGSTAGYGMAQAFLQTKSKKQLEAAKNLLRNTRPTAYNLFYAIERVYNAGAGIAEEAQRIAEENVHNCEKIGSFGEKLIQNRDNILTHCNAGWLACVDWGTALSPIYKAKRNGKDVFVFVDETRPRSQGARLTAWELSQEKTRHAIIADNAAAHYMQKGEIDMVIVGADRIALNGDVANKIGTLEKAICAKEFGVPFYVAAPTSTIDKNTKNGKDIPIEERSEDEVHYQNTAKGKVRVTAPGSPARNPAFDVTPAKYITGIITEKGIIKTEKVRNIVIDK